MGTSAEAAEPHFSFTPSFIALTDSATPGTTTFYPNGWLPLGAHVVDGATHKTRVYFGFDIGGVPRARLRSAQLRVIDMGATDCSKPRALEGRPVADFTTANSWNRPPASAGSTVTPVAEAPGCEAVINFDLTAGLDKALQRQQRRLYVEIKVPGGKENELAYGRYLDQNNFHLNVELTNTAPRTPTKLTYDGDTDCFAATYYAGTDFTVRADQSDPDAGDALRTEIEYWPLSDPAATTPIQTFQGSGGDGVFGFGTIQIGGLAEAAYGWHARTYDQRAYSAWSAACTFVVDRTVPNTPGVSSTDYPENPPAPTGEVGHPGTFTFTANGSDDVVEFLYGTSPFSLFQRVAADHPGGSATVQWTPRATGVQTLYVASLDRAHLRSPARAYKINVRSYGVNAYPTGQAPDPAGTRAAVVTMHFETQAGNGLTRFAYSIDGGAQQFAPVGADGVTDVQTAPLGFGEHTLTYAGQDSAGTSHYDPITTTFYVLDAPAITSDGVYPIDGTGGGVGVEGVFTVTPYVAADVQDVQYFTTSDSNHRTVTVDADGKARVHWTPTEPGWTYFWFAVRYTDGTVSSWQSFAVTVNG
ncbi:hypothetical protein Daura_23655 [Dactylosporangium aurantiacum]|uniref:DNRLRE domain-containing protein n=1 Tax=Dactylosporangium aurantiacum TaxID=35754 RepID=A0A9Q9ISA8_9ACTN|nr:hypothetical protein [Dactylosporangium aurantiacum]MDG6103914.1 hypothetical protein [Dactylosporangium aurantiacum]UWZ58897.1 hypothetical protein Daura_23655 [Dactylosporangium aurantiacum]